MSFEKVFAMMVGIMAAVGWGSWMEFIKNMVEGVGIGFAGALGALVATAMWDYVKKRWFKKS